MCSSQASVNTDKRKPGLLISAIKLIPLSPVMIINPTPYEIRHNFMLPYIRKVHFTMHVINKIHFAPSCVSNRLCSTQQHLTGLIAVIYFL